ncbi:MAG TPA: cobyrinate a,c-diamide synthase [Novimethylophilus sp.]|jgi:cobyrinic acid a,c-diamide synthase|uniref:cobyrinate a,c-diamide synthase n=1 Tax=Novimethylophilus sp. TaxID=2137426 RepID=UPI002F41915B
MSTVDCPALLVAAPSSGSGKTSVTAALARHFAHQGKRVRVFKTGPDFIDPGILECASGAPVYQLDLWMVGEMECRRLLAAAARAADLILIEGAMGLFDGTPSSADLAAHFGIPVLAVIDASAQAQTFGALAWGLASYRSGLPFAGVLANRVGGPGHADMLKTSLPGTIQWLGWMPHEREAGLPERHLGLVLADEQHDLNAKLDQLAGALVLDDALQPAPARFAVPDIAAPPLLLQGRHIAIARDQAFAFIYRANLDLLSALGATLEFFSPLADSRLPQADAYYFPGGYPELHLDGLSANTGLRDNLRAAHATGKPILAECGGMMALFDAITDIEGRRRPAWGLLPGEVKMQARLGGLGLQSIGLPEGTLRGHTFHYSTTETSLAPLVTAVKQSGTEGEAVYRRGRLTASYLHTYWPSNPQAAAALFLP